MKKEVIYLGERADRVFGKIEHMFRDSKGNTYSFYGIKNVYPGNCYWMFEEGRMKIKPERIDKPKLEYTDQDRLDFEAHKEICKQVRLERRKALQLKKPHPDIVKAINLLKPFVRNLGPTDTHRFTSYIREQISKKGKK